MTHTEAADLILSEADAPPMDWYLPEVRAEILAAVATVMDAARADARTPRQLDAEVVARVQKESDIAEARHGNVLLRLSDVQAMLAALSVPIAT